MWAFWAGSLLADTEFADNVAVAIGIVRLQVVQKAATLADQLQQTATRSVILLVRLEVFGQFSDTRTQNCDLDLRRTGVRIMGAEAFNQGCFLSGRQHGVCYSSCLLSPRLSVYREITMNERVSATFRLPGRRGEDFHGTPEGKCPVYSLREYCLSWWSLLDQRSRPSHITRPPRLHGSGLPQGRRIIIACIFEQGLVYISSASLSLFVLQL